MGIFETGQVPNILEKQYSKKIVNLPKTALIHIGMGKQNRAAISSLNLLEISVETLLLF
jgi:hypothetical protein